MQTKILNNDNVMKELRKVIDPELGQSIIDLGLVYKVEVEKGKVKVLMTFTSPFCPYGETLVDEVKETIKNIKLKPEIEITFDPPWGPDKIEPELRAALGYG